MRKVTKTAAAAMVVLAGGAVNALAADMSLPPMYQLEPEPMVEFGSGWYLRGDIGYSSISAPMGSPPVMVDSTVAPASASSIMNNRTANFGVLNGTLGAGYQFNRWFRMDATFDWRENLTTNRTTYGANCAIDIPAIGNASAYVLYDNPACYVKDSVTIKTWTGLVNAYGDLGTWFGVTPYIGGGVGLTNIRANASEMYYQNNDGSNYGGAGVNSYKSSVVNAIIHYGYPGNVGPTQVRTNFAYALMGGLAYDLAPHLKLDIGYRYLNMGSLSVVNTSGATVRKTLDAQEVRAGLRWTPDL